MRLHLPSSLRKSLLFAISTVAATLGSQTADAAVLFDGVGIQTYADFGQNCGRFVAGEVNAMLTEIREREGGIVITYQSDNYKPYTISLDQGMIDFASASSNPVAAAVGYAYLATVSHNGVIDPTYTALEVGGQNAVRYSSIDFKRGTPFHMEAATDYKIARLNKIVTDVQPSEFYSGTDPQAELDGEFLYRTGAGAMDLALIDADGVWRRTQELDLPYSFATGGIVVLEWAEPSSHLPEHDGNFGIFHHVNPKFAEEIAANPLPYRVRSGDSGSPTWVWNPETETYQYISAGQSGGQYFTQDRGDLKWSEYAIDSCGVQVELGTADHTITLGAVATEEAKITGVGDTVEVSTTPYSGTMTYTDTTGAEKQQKYIGIETIQSGKHTWKDLSPVKDQDNWFNYGNEYFNVAKYGPTEEKPGVFSFADMFVTDNLIFEAGDGNTYNIVLDADVDLGIGYVQLSKADGVGTASFKLQSEHLLESAGFAIDAGVTLELDMKATEARMVEWRKAGAGDLRITGSGDTNALLNVGGSGTVSLKRTGGYAAYNVLASSGSTLVIDNLQQVYRDVTLGAGGATLDLNGNDFTWDNSATPDGNGFKSLHMLVEKDVVTNNSNSAITITINDPGTEAFVGAFKDVEGRGAINVVYDSSSENPWVMNTVFTKLRNEGSSFTVENGGVILQGINTVHGKQLLGRRVVNEFDWHYADAAMDVTVKDGAEFTLGSHARLTGDVTVEGSGVFTMTEYTTHRMEYMEGGVKMDDTYAYRDYFGLHGDVNLVGEGSMFYVQFAPQHYYQDTDSESVYDGKITGSGSMVVDTAGGSLRLSGQNTFSGAKELLGGTLVATGTSALGNTSENKWLVYDRGVLAVETAGAEAALAMVDGDSNGVLALTRDETGAAPDLRGHQNLIIGAVGDVQFGAENTQQTLATNDDNQWLLGGGGGTLYVNYKLDDDAGVLVLGNQYTTGRVVLTNAGNNISRIELVGGVSLDYDTDDALGGAKVLLQYGNRMMGSASLIGLVTPDADGAVLLDQMSDATINLATRGNLSLAADKTVEFTGTIDLGKNNTYHFGGGGGHLVLDTVLTDGEDSSPRHMVVDGQFYRPTYGSDEGFDSGDIIELKKALQITGDVTVQGFDFNRAPEDDPTYVLFHFSTATLQLSVNDALESVHSLVLADGGFVDMNGTTQTLHGFATEEPVLGLYGIVDNSDSQKSKLILDVSAEDEWERWSPIYCNLAAHELVKTGDGTLYLVSAVNESSLFTIEDGTVEIYTNDALNSDGLTRVVGNGILDASGLEDTLDNKTIELNDGGTMLIGPDAISGRISANSGTGTIDALEGSANLAATIGAAQGATLALSNGSFTLRAEQNNTEGGTIDLQGGTLSLNCAGGVFIGGTLKVGQNATLKNTTGSDEAVHVIASLNMQNNATLNMEGNGKSLLWDIHRLDGNGTINWNAGNSTKSTLMLDGEGTFSGTLQVQGGASTMDTPSLLLAHDLAAQNATVSLQGNSSTSIASLAVGAENVKIAGLNGNANSVVFDYVPTEASTLTTTGTGTYTFAGSVAANEGARLNLAMEGSGSQTYSGTVQARDVSVLGGTLALRENQVDITGNVTVARGATFATDQGLTLGSGQYLCSTGETGAAGSVNSAVTFSGGGLRFDAAGLNESNAALRFNNGVTATGNVAVDFTNTSFLTAGSTLSLTDGYNWNLNNLTATGLDYLDATFKMSGNILQVSFDQMKGNRIWDGTTAQHAWSSSEFGQGGSFTSTDKAVFNDSAENTDVQVTSEVSAAALLFDNSKGYTVNTTEDGMLSTEEVILNGAGVVTLDAGVLITQKADIAAGSTLVLKDTASLWEGSTVVGDGTLAVDSDFVASLDGMVTHIGSVELRGGTLFLSKSLSAGDLVVNEGTTLSAATSSILDNNATVHSAGTVMIEIVSKEETLSNAIAAGQGGAGTFVKVGGGTLYVAKSLVADTVRVEHGSLRTSNTSIVPDFLATTKLLEVDSGATAYIGGNAYTIPDQPVATNMVVDGGTLELAIAQNTTRTISGDLTINSGKLQKVDGGLIFTGTTTLGNSIADQVTLAGNWGKSGTIFNGLVQGEGKVTLAKGNSVEKFTFNNGDNTFSGEIKATSGTQLVAGHKTALAQASNINLQDNSTLVLATGEVDIKSLNGSGAVEFSAADDSSSTTLNITDGGSFAGAVEGNISISKSGSGTFALTGESTQFNGDLYVKEGIMSLGSSALGMLGSASSVTVKSGASLQLGGAANVAGPMDIQGSLSMGGDVSSRDSVQLAATGSLAGGSHTLEANSLVIEGVGGTNVETAASQTLGAGSSLTMFGDPTTSITLQADAEAMIYVVNNVQDVTLSGESLTINLSGVEQQLQPGQWMGITLGETASMGTGMLVECVMGDGQKMQGYYLSSSSGGSGSVYFKTEQIVSKDLIWDNATKNSNWSTSQNDKNWHAPDAADGSSYFTTGANVQFDAGKNTVTLADNITAGDMVLVSGADVSIVNADEYIQEFANVTIAENARLSFVENCFTTITDTLALNGTVTNSGYLEIASGTVDTDATGVLAGEGMTYLSGVISNDGTVKLDHATLAGDPGAAITGNVVINGGDLYGTMTLGSEGSTVSVTEAFDITGVEEYTILGNVKLDNLSGAEFYYAEGVQDVYNNGFFIGMDVTVFTMDYDPEIGTPIDFQGTVTYQGMEGSIEYGVFTAYVEDYSTFHVNVDTETPESLTHAREASAAQGKQLNEVHMVADGTKLAVDSTASLPNLRVTSGEGAANLLQGGEGPHTLTVTNLTLDGKLSVGEDVTLKLDTQLSGTTPDLANLANAGGTVSVAMGNGDNVLTMDASSIGSLELRSGYISYRSELGEQALHLASGTQLWFGSNAGTKDDAVFTNDIVLDGNATVRVYGSSDHSSATISGNVTGDNYTLTKTDGNQNLIFSGVVNVGGLTTAGDGNGTIVFNGGEGSIGDIVTNGATKIRFSAGTTPGAKNTYSFDTFNIAPSNGERWLIVDENVTVHGTGSDLGNDNIHATINGGWNLNGGGLEVNGTLDLAGVISFDGPGNSSIKGAGIINTTGLNISNGTNTTVQGGVTINITSNTGIKKRAGSNSTLNLADATLTATTVDWELQNSVNSVNLTNASDGTTFEAAQGRTITLTKQMGGSGKLVKAGEGTVLAKGANTYSGGTSIDAGTVTTSHATALGTGNVTVAANAVLQVNENLTIKGDNTANHNGLGNLGSVSIADGKTLSLYALVVDKQYNLGTVNLAGASASIENTNHCGTLSLENVIGAADSSMSLFSNHSSSPATWNLGTADSGSFAGCAVVLKVGDSTDTGGARTVNYNFNNGNMFADTEVRLENATVTRSGKTMTNNVVLNAAEIHMGGINDAAADTVTDTRKWSVFKGDAVGERAKLVLDGNAESGYSSAVKIGSAIDIEKTGTATQAFTGDMSGFHGSVDVEAGVLNILNAASLAVKDVTIGANSTLGVYNGATATADTGLEGSLTIKNGQSLTAKGAGATLNANVVMETGSTLDVHGTEGAGLSMGSAITLNMGMNLSSADFANVTGLMEGERYILFNGVDELTLTGSAYTPFTAPITLEAQVDAADYYNNLARGQYFLVYDGSNVGNVAIFSTVPEPATGTLSLLALAALAARRRRKA